MPRAFLKRLLLAAGRVPRYLPVGYPSPQREVRVTLDGLATPHDVTHTHVMVALRPLILALAPPPGVPAGALVTSALSLRLTPWSEPETTLGSVQLRHEAELATDGSALHLFRQSGSRNAAMPPAAQAVFDIYHRWGDWKRRHQRNTPMVPDDLRAIQVLYMCPRPVVLVSVQHGDASNLFPMDLIGQTEGPHFLLGLRNTSPSIRLIKESGRVAVSDAPLELTRTAFKLGEHHSKERIDWGALPFPTAPSAGHGLPVPVAALRVRDLEVRESRDIGSHTLFITRVTSDERRRDWLQMCFLAGSYYRHLALHGLTPAMPTDLGR